MKKLPFFIVLTTMLVFSGTMVFLAHRGGSRQGMMVVSPAYRAYVQAFTSGIVSTRSVIRVRLADDFADTVSFNVAVKENFFNFSPAIKGKTTWSDSRTIEFRPDEKLPQGQLYTATFALSRLLPVPDSLKNMLFQFRTMLQETEVEVDNHKAYSHANLSREHLNGMLRTSDVADDALVEKVLTAKQDGRSLPILWNHDPKTRVHNFQVDSVRRNNNAGEVKLDWDGAPIDSKTTGSLVTVIPALGDFRVLSVKSLQDAGQTVQVQFSDPLKPDQGLEGLFRVGKFHYPRYAIEDNLLLIYLPETQDRKLRLTLEPAIRNIGRLELGKRVEEDILVDNTKPGVRFTGDGVILPGTNGMLLPFEAVNLNSVDVKVIRIFEKNILQFLQVNELNGTSELTRVGRVVLKKTIPLSGVTDYAKWNRYSIDLSKLMQTEPGAIYSVFLGFRKNYSTYPGCRADSVKSGESGMMTIGDPEAENETNWRYYSSYSEDEDNGEGWQRYVWNERNDPCKASYYFNRTISRNVLASNLGIIAKCGSDGNYHVFVTDIATTKPLSGVEIEFYNYQLQVLAKATTDADGKAVVAVTKRPFVLVARNAKESGYLKLADGNALSLSMFDVSGEPVQKGIKGFIYGERGVWRPGDSIFLSFILEDKTRKLPEHHPVSFSLYNPSGQMITRLVRTNPLNGFYRFSVATPPDATTGNWLAKVGVGGVDFQKTLKIETVKPNRLKINFDFKTEVLVKDEVPAAMLQATWLTGATAHNLRAKVMLTLSKSVTAFKNYPGYVFDNPTAGFAAENITVFDGRLDAGGKTLVTPKIHVTNIAPGALKASFETTVFEDGGDFSIDRFTIPYYPYQSYAGISVPLASSGDRVLYTDKTYDISLLNVNARGQLIPSNRLKVEVFKLEWRWWWDDSEAGSADFISTSYIRPFDSATVKTVNGKGTFPFQVGYNEWGRYLVRVTDRASGHAAGKVVYVDWPGYYRMPGGEKQAAAMLTLTTAKTQYRVGEKVDVTLPASPDGRALVTVETGSKILKSWWVPTSRGSTVISFDATGEMAPNCYVYVTLIQPHAQVKNDLPIRLYGVIPVKVEDPETYLKPVITMPGELVPGKNASIQVREAGGKAMTYTLAMVDDGLLDLTRFKTPDAWSAFYAREALGVKTWDMFDMVMGAFSGELQRILSIGGDQEALNRGGLKANRFKPMVKFLGPFELKKGQTAKHNFIMPEYIGSVRVMVVAGQDGAYGKDEKTVPVKKPLMVLGTLPRVLGPGESVRLAVNVFTMEKSIRNVKVELFVNELLSVKGGNSRQLTFNEIGDQLATFDLGVENATGIGKVRIVATSGNEKSEHLIEIDVRNPNLPVTDVLEKVIQPGTTWTTEFMARGIPGTNRATLEVSSIPPLNLEKRMDDLIHYPYGCVEQTVSSVFPQLFLSGIMELTETEKKETGLNIRAALQQLKSFQLSNGGLSYWPGSTYADDWGTSYAGNFILEAETKGYSIPVNFLSSWKEFQRQKAVSWSYNAGYNNDDLSQAYRLYTLALARVPELGAMNKLLEFSGLSTAARWRLAAAYELSGRKEVALQLISKTETAVKQYRELACSYGSDLRDKAMIAEALCLVGLKTKAAPLVKEISAALAGNEWFSTQETSFAIMAVARFTGDAPGSGINATLRVNAGTTEELGSKMSLLARKVEIKPGKKGILQVANKGKNILFGRLILTGIPATGDTTSASNSLKITVAYKSMKGDPIKPQSLEQGTSFMAEVMLTNPGQRGKYQQMALSQVFPSGWEVINARSSDLAQTTTAASVFDYQDVRDDRVCTFFELGPGQFKTFRVLLMAAYPGRFYLPAVRCEAMYDHTISARSPGRWVEVTPVTK